MLENNKMDAANRRLSVFVCSSLRFGTHAYAPLLIDAANRRLSIFVVSFPHFLDIDDRSADAACLKQEANIWGLGRLEG